MSTRKNTSNSNNRPTAAATDSASDVDQDGVQQKQQQSRRDGAKRQQQIGLASAESSKFPWAIAALAVLGCLYMFSNQGQDRAVTRQTRTPIDQVSCPNGKYASVDGTAALDGWCQANCNNPGNPYCPISTCKCAAGGGQQTTECSGRVVCPKNNYIAIAGTGATNKWCYDSCTNPGAPDCPCKLCTCSPPDPVAIVDGGWFSANLDAGGRVGLVNTITYTSIGVVQMTTTDRQASGNSGEEMLHIALDGTQFYDTTPGTGGPYGCSTEDDCLANPHFTHSVHVLPAGTHTIRFTPFNLIGGGTYSYRIDTIDCAAGPNYIVSKINAPVKFGNAAVACPTGYSLADIVDNNWTPIAAAMTGCYGDRQGAWVKTYGGNPTTCMSITSGDGTPGNKGSVNQVPCDTYLPVVCKKN